MAGPLEDLASAAAQSPSGVTQTPSAAHRRGPEAVSSLRSAGRVLLRLPRSVAWVLPLAWALLIWRLSSESKLLESGLSLPEWLESVLFNLAHPAAFGLLALFLVPLMPRLGEGRERWVAWTLGRGRLIFGVVLLYGIVDELHQSHVPGRVPSPFDTLSDAVGALGVLAVVAYLSRPEATRSGVVRRLVAAAVASVAAAVLSSAWTWLVP